MYFSFGHVFLMICCKKMKESFEIGSFNNIRSDSVITQIWKKHVSANNHSCIRSGPVPDPA